MSFARWFWLVLVIACVVWYSTVTVYVAIRGAGDVRGMLRRLGSGDGSND
jgi:hypothetical protein